MKTIDIRRSVRKFKDTPVESEKIEKLLRAAMQAPSASNQQPWEFIVVTDREKLDTLSEFSPYSKLIKGAPLRIVVLRRTNAPHPYHADQDLGACCENMLLEAVDIGLGGVWMGAGAEGKREGDERDENIRKVFPMPPTVTPMGVLAFGYPLSDGANHYVDRFDESRIHFNGYRSDCGKN